MTIQKLINKLEDLKNKYGGEIEVDLKINKYPMYDLEYHDALINIENSEITFENNTIFIGLEII